MRIVAGTARGRVFKGPKDATRIRPTADRVRETLFNILGQSLEGLDVLDLFAGTGALGLEAISRGAHFAVLVDSGREAIALCRENAEVLGMAGQVEIVARPVEKVIADLASSGRAFDLVFVDPPYELKAGASTLTALSDCAALNPGARVFYEHSKHEALEGSYGTLVRVDERTFGETVVTFFERPAVSIDP